VLLQEMRARAKKAGHRIVIDRARQEKKKRTAAVKTLATKTAKKIRESLFRGLSRSELERHIRNNSAEWQMYETFAAAAAKWDQKRIRDELFSPKVRGKRSSRGGMPARFSKAA